jgi:hypothetical protein
MSRRKQVGADNPVPASEDEEAPIAAETEALPADSTPLARYLIVTRGYRGAATAERFIAPGLYREDQAELCGLAEFLVGLGFAEWQS